jgi:hypothetical protein
MGCGAERAGQVEERVEEPRDGVGQRLVHGLDVGGEAVDQPAGRRRVEERGRRRQHAPEQVRVDGAGGAQAGELRADDLDDRQSDLDAVMGETVILAENGSNGGKITV